MKFLILTSLVLFSLVASAYQAIDFSPLQVQYRFEDTSAQSKETVAYQSLSANLQKEFLRFGFGYSRHNDDTGNSSLHIETEKKEYLANLGYQALVLDGKNNNLRLDLFVEAVLGITQSRVATTLLGSTMLSTSNNDIVYGPGLAAIGRYSYFLLESDFQFLFSKAFSPQYVPIFTVKAGLSFPIP